jgi:hypothetical protein
MNQIITVLAYHRGDFDLAKQLLAWIGSQNEGPINAHLCLLGDSLLEKDQRLEMKEIAQSAFSSVASAPVKVETALQKWPTGPNKMFEKAMAWIQESYRLPFLWMEPDAVTLKKGWLDQIEEAYYGQPSRYMGAFGFPGESPDKTLPERWMTGPGVYPNDASAELARFCGSEKPFDVVAASTVVARMKESPLFQHFWGKQNLPPTFVSGKPKAPNAVNLSFLRPEAVIFHRVKDGSLFRALSAPESAVVTETDEQPGMLLNASTATPRPEPPHMTPPPIPVGAGLNAVPPVQDNAFGGGRVQRMGISTDPKKPVSVQ